MSKGQCLAEVLSTMTKKGESVLAPKPDPDHVKRVVAAVRGLAERRQQSSGCLLSALSDLAKQKYIYSESDGFKKIRVQRLNMVLQFDSAGSKRGTALTSFVGRSDFNLLAMKDSTPGLINNAFQFWLLLINSHQFVGTSRSGLFF